MTDHLRKTEAEAQRIAANVAKLPELLQKRKAAEFASSYFRVDGTEAEARRIAARGEAAGIAAEARRDSTDAQGCAFEVDQLPA